VVGHAPQAPIRGQPAGDSISDLPLTSARVYDKPRAIAIDHEATLMRKLGAASGVAAHIARSPLSICAKGQGYVESIMVPEPLFTLGYTSQIGLRNRVERPRAPRRGSTKESKSNWGGTE